MRTIIIAGTYCEATAYMRRNGLDFRDTCFGQPAAGLHYDRLVLVGSWWKVRGVRREIDIALNCVNPKPKRRLECTHGEGKRMTDIFHHSGACMQSQQYQALEPNSMDQDLWGV